MVVLSPEEAAMYLKLSINTLAAWRHQRKGPRFIKTGRTVKYSREDLDGYLKSNTKETGKEEKKGE